MSAPIPPTLPIPHVVLSDREPHIWPGTRVIALAVVVGIGAGAASALFLWLLGRTTTLWDQQPLLIWGLPLVGAVMAAAYRWAGARAGAGNNLVIDAVHDPDGNRVPLRMFPLVLGSTLLTHLCGGSAGREGTAVQMAGSVAGAVIRAARLDTKAARLLLMAGISAGFASVFGTPLAGTIFGMEVLAAGTIRTRALLPCLVAAVVGDGTVRMLGIGHAHYVVHEYLPLSVGTTGWLVIAGFFFGLIAVVFIESTHHIDALATRFLPDPVWRIAVGGIVLIGLTSATGTRQYNGLGLPLLAAAFSPDGVVAWAFALKILFTVVTLGMGYKGGEVTPLFVIGATAGATLGIAAGLPPAFMAALGFATVFGAAAQTPIACLVLGVELFGAGIALPMAVTLAVASAAVGQRGIYHAQRLALFHEGFTNHVSGPRRADVWRRRR